MKHFAFLIFAMLMAGNALAWDGYDYNSGSYVEIEKGNLVRPGREIEFYDYGTGEYRHGSVETITNRGSSVEVEVYDQQTGEYRTFDMDKDE